MSTHRVIDPGPLTILLAGTLLTAGCGGESPGHKHPAADQDPVGPPWFKEQAAQRGLLFEHASGHDKHFYFPELMGGGAALFDMDGDGDLDAFVVQSGSLESSAVPQHGLFENGGDGTFTDRSEAVEAQTPGYGMGVTSADYDADGDIDLYVTQVGSNMLLRNEGGGRFSDQTSQAGCGNLSWGTSACFFDKDKDGDLDLFVANYLDWKKEEELDCFGPTGQPDYCGPTSYGAPSLDTLYENQGDGTFVDVTLQAGLQAAYGNGLGVVAGDFDGDLDLDLFVANDQTPDQMWINQGDGTFVDRAELMGCARDRNGGSRAGMGVDTADLEGDGDLDLLVVHMARENDGLFFNQGRYFVERTVEVGLGSAHMQRTRFGVGFFDFNNDSHLDIFVANGRVNLQMEPLDSRDPYAEPNTLLSGSKGGRFNVEVPDAGLMATSRGAAFGDVDGDGGMDVLVVNRDGPAHLFLNQAPSQGSWLQVELRDPRGLAALGGWIELRTGESAIRREIKTGSSYLSSNPARAHFGLGTSGPTTKLLVTWPDGERETFDAEETNCLVVLERGKGRAAGQ